MLNLISIVYKIESLGFEDEIKSKIKKIQNYSQLLMSSFTFTALLLGEWKTCHESLQTNIILLLNRS
jgi:hypothetical protein